ncbi:MAG: transposase [Bauldia sp.]|nr:MAG: transposase [Bauldia sp.]
MSRDRYDHSDVTTPVRPRRVEVLTGPERRRRWSDETKIAIVAEALTGGVVVSDVARRHDITPSQLFGWMRQFRDAALSTMTPAEPPMFAPAVVDVAPTMSGPSSAPAEPPAAIEISVGAATVRIRGAVDGKMLAAVLKALRVLA